VTDVVIGSSPLQRPLSAVRVPLSAAMPEIEGRPLFDGAEAASTTAVRAETALLSASPLRSSTSTRTVPPTSPDASSYVEPEAPETAAQWAPVRSQRSQRYVTDPPLHEPLAAVST
jgi:hypothetical protein